MRKKRIFREEKAVCFKCIIGTTNHNWEEKLILLSAETSLLWFHLKTDCPTRKIFVSVSLNDI